MPGKLFNWSWKVVNPANFHNFSSLIPAQGLETLGRAVRGRGGWDDRREEGTASFYLYRLTKCFPRERAPECKSKIDAWKRKQRRKNEHEKVLALFNYDL